MLTLIGPDSRIELDILNYQFGNPAHDGWDSEWLQVAGRVECSRGRWNFVDPCLTTFELASLASWFREFPRPVQPSIEFTEPNLRFERVNESNGDVLRVHFSQEASPPWATESERFGDGYALQIPFASISFDEAARAVEQLCQRFPERAHRGGV
jgi:hypothetical protein